MDVVLVGLLLTGALVSPLIAIIMAICVVTGKWMTLAEMGRPRWAALVPFYADWQLCMGASGNVSLAVTVVVTEAANALAQSLVPEAAGWVATVVSLVAVVVNCALCHKVALSFGRGVGLAVALVLVPAVAYPVLALGSARYRGPVDGQGEPGAGA